MKKTRLDRVVRLMREQAIPQLLISDPVAIFYLTGKWFDTGERLLALHIDETGGGRLFINEIFPFSEDLGVEVIRFGDTQDPVTILSEQIKPCQMIGVDKNWPARFLLKFLKQNPGCNVVNGSEPVDTARMQKDPEEVKLMREASRLNDRAMAELIKRATPELTEKQLAKQLPELYESLGAEGVSFAPIIAYGTNAALPHHEPGLTLLKPGDAVIFDIGGRRQSYCSDMTRTVFYKQASAEAKKVYNIVREANLKGIAAVRPGARFCDVDAAARSHIEQAGYGPYFTHRTGHSIGIEVHDFGDVSATNQGILKPGMIFSVEPGIYLPGRLGVRIEDLVVVTEAGCEVLNQFPKELTIIG